MLSASARTASRPSGRSLPDRRVGQEAAHVLAADQRDVLAEFLPIQLDQAPAVFALLASISEKTRAEAG